MFCICLFYFLIGTILSAPNSTEFYLNKLILKDPDEFILYWNYNDTDILIETHAKTTGWSSFGISPTGGMDNSDVVVSWINTDGTYHFTDRHIRGRQVIVDKIQNWIPISIFQQDSYLISKFTRKIKICDETNEDLDIPQGTPMTIYSYGSVLINDDIGYHGSNRGTKTVALISSLNESPKINLDEVETVDFRTNYTLDGIKDTEYHCTLFKLPDSWMKQKRHLIRYETLFSAGTEENFHHWTVNECGPKFEAEFLKNHPIPEPGYCYSDNWLKLLEYCRRVSLVWAIGGSIIQDFPEDLAYPLGGNLEQDTKYFYLEIHYDNPRLKKDIVDHSGIRLYGTTNYRKTEFGVLTVGTSEDFQGLVIPPRAESFKVNYGCTRECTDHLFDEHDEIKIFSTMPHTHLSGKEVYTKVVRDGNEIAYLANNKYYDFNYQYYNFLSKPVTLKKGDELITNCVYSTKNKANFTYGGLSTNEEMCFTFIWYYPRTPVSTCIEVIELNKWINFLTDMKSSGEIEADINISKDFYKRGDKDLKLKASNPSWETIKKFQNFHNENEKIQVCIKNGNITNTINKPHKISPIIDDTCPPKTIHFSTTTRLTTFPTKKPLTISQSLFSSSDRLALHFYLSMFNVILAIFFFKA